MRFKRRCCNIVCSFVCDPSGSPEDRTQHYAVISRVWATSPRLPFKVGHPGVEPPAADAANSQRCSCSQSRRAPICTSARLSPVRTAGFEPAISWSPTRRDARLRHVLLSAARAGVEPASTPTNAARRCPKGVILKQIDERAKLARGSRVVGREVLESSSPGFQPGATPSQLPTQTKKARRLGDTGLCQARSDG